MGNDQKSPEAEGCIVSDIWKELVDDLQEFRGKVGPQVQAFAREGMRDVQGPGVEKEPMQVVTLPKIAVDAAFAISGVADDLMGDAAEMAADLMPASGLDAGGDQRDVFAGMVIQRLDVGDGRAGRLPFLQGEIDGQGRVDTPAGQSQIDFARVGLTKLIVPAPGGFAAEGVEQHAAGGPVQTMDGECSTAKLARDKLT